MATDHHKRMIEKHRSRLEEIQRARVAGLRTFADDLGRQSVTIEANANDEGHLYGSVGAVEIANALKATAGAPTLRDERFEQWCHGRTGMPLVDACMRELLATGFMSNRGRQVVASYLVNDLQQDWRHGAAWFEEHLLDYDPASNWGNWAYLAGVASDPRHHRLFNALRQARQYDPQAEYISLWLPELRNVPVHLRHTPFLLNQLQLSALNYPRLEQIPEAWRPYMPSAA